MQTMLCTLCCSSWWSSSWSWHFLQGYTCPQQGASTWHLHAHVVLPQATQYNTAPCMQSGDRARKVKATMCQCGAEIAAYPADVDAYNMYSEKA